MKKFAILLLSLLILTSCISKNTANTESASSFGNVSSQKGEAIKELRQVTGANKIGELFGNAIIQQMTNTLKQSQPNINPRAFDILNEETQRILREELVEKESFLPFVYPVYDKYFSLEEIEGLIQFYKTPLGRKTVSVMPQITQEGMKAGQLWAESIFPVLQQRLIGRFQNEGIDFRQ